MGAFFLHLESEPFDRKAVELVFSRKSFPAPRVVRLGEWTLWHFAKQLVGGVNHVELPGGDAIYAVGTPVYRGRGYEETLGLVLADVGAGRFDPGALRGNFAMLVWVGGRLRLLTDGLGVCHLFADAAGTRVSTSFQAVLASSMERRRLNRLAVIEKLATGYVVGSETIVEGIRRFTADPGREWQVAGLEWVPPSPGRLELASPATRWQDCLAEHLERLRRYFQDIGPLAREHGVDLGLSSGYDSRLVALLTRPLGARFSVHTHWTQGVHDTEKARVEGLARALGLPLRVTATRPLEQLPTEELEALLRDGLYYYDGRAADNSGAYSMTYTRWYKSTSLGEHRLRLNGEGGEIYRNYYFTSRGRLDFRTWMRNHLYYGPTPLALAGTGLEEEMTEHVLGKLSARLDTDVRGTVDLAVTRAYYGEVRLPECEGALANADAQVTHFLMPFAEPELQRAAYRLTAQVGVSGRFQAGLIERLDPAIAALPSHHGFPISAEPLGHRLKAGLRGYLPDTFWLRRKARRFADPRFGEAGARSFQQARARSAVLREAEECLRAFVPGFDLAMALREPPGKATALYLGLLLREFSAQLRPD